MANRNLRRRVGTRSAIVCAATVGFVVGAAGFAAAQHDDAPAPSTVATVPDDTIPDVTIPDVTTPDTSVPAVDDGPGTTIDLTVPDVDDPPPADDTVTTATIDDSLPSDDTIPDTSVPGDDTSTTIDDETSSTVPDDSVPAPALPARFTETYSSAGGSITVGWSGTRLSLDAVGPAPGYTAEIEHQSWDRIRVDFESEDDDRRIEIRLDDGSIRLRVD